ncbi:MAG: DEAD/DEAH box helicase [Tepidisphaerales bacterium]
MAERTISLSSLIAGEQGLSPFGQWLDVQLRILKASSERPGLPGGDCGGDGVRGAGAEAEGGEEPASERAIAAAANAGSMPPAGAELLPPQWQLTRGVSLYDWQRECAQRWLDGGRRGIVKVVTGGGKTVFAQHLIERLHNEQDAQLRVAVVVPTIVLMEQWVESLRSGSNLPPDAIGAMGGGRNDAFSERVRILVCVINSAARHLPAAVRSADIGRHLLLVVDECHRARGQVMSRIFDTPRIGSLGLSATPEQDGGEASADAAAGESPQRTEPTEPPDAEESLEPPANWDILTTSLGPVIYELRPADAIRLGILSTFEFRHYGLPLNADERVTYERLSRSIRDLTERLRAAMQKQRGRGTTSLAEFARRCSSRTRSALRDVASEYLLLVRRRKHLLYRARARTDAVLELMRRAFAEKPDARVLVFHESVDEVSRLHRLLLEAGYAVTADHSKLPDAVRAESISLFRRGIATVLVSARTLIEGFDVPSADVGIIAASSSSPRQRIQTIGRLLRRPKDGTAKRAVIHTLYMAGTIDEAIYEKLDWRTVTGAEDDLYFRWRPPPSDPQASADARPTAADTAAEAASEPQPQPGPPRHPKPTEDAVDLSQLKPGDVYPGRFEGTDYRCDEQGNVLTADGRPVSNPQGVPQRLHLLAAGASKFCVTPKKRAVLVWDAQARAPRFLGVLEQPFDADGVLGDDTVEYRIVQYRGQRRIRDQRGRLASGTDAERIVAAVGAAERQHRTPITRVFVDGHLVYCVLAGERRPLGELERGFDFS